MSLKRSQAVWIFLIALYALGLVCVFFIGSASPPSFSTRPQRFTT